MDARFDLVGLGEGLVELSADGALATARVLDVGASGDVPNALVAAARLGSRTALLSRVGTDGLGDFLIDAWRRDNIDVGRVRRDPERPTGAYFVGVKASGERDLVFHRQGSAGVGIVADVVRVDFDVFAEANLFLTSGMTQALSPSACETVRTACAAASRAGAAVAFDVNYHPPMWPSPEAARAAVDDVLGTVSILLASAPRECAMLFGIDDAAKFSRDALAFGVEMAAIKMKGRGCVVSTRRETREVPFSGDLQVVDPTGGGDAFDGAFLHAIAHGADPFAAAELAVREWERNLSRRGATR
ncbi:MAG: sugar kinase [Planctomycetes bacterium]|nr:sugar kinase [Planctomycetota bacterium]MBI3846067.1 sugar kinase [Planctomycetota bacterium]